MARGSSGADAFAMIGMVAFVTQYDAEVGASALATVIVGFGVFHLCTGRSADLRRSHPRTIRLVGALQILVGVGLGVASFRLNREPAWGGAPQIVALVIWLSTIGAVTLVGIRKYRSSDAAASGSARQ